ncbi:MAG: class I SAM-dependent methyltransferase, partial [Gammaproteobacteria bacterium]
AQGWITRAGVPGSESMVFEVTPLGEIAAKTFPQYAEVAEFAYSGIPMDRHLFHQGDLDAANAEHYARIIRRCIQNWDLALGDPADQESRLYEIIGKHLDGMLAGPFMVAAKLRGLLKGDYFTYDQFPGPHDNLRAGLALIEHLGWVQVDGRRHAFTQLGRVACEFTLHYGLTLSYWPMFCQLPSLIFNSSHHITHVAPGHEETHVDRGLNVLASGVAHRPYFEDSERILTAIFNREPLSEQPRFVSDMGCGDGIWLKRIYEIVASKTLRGRHLDEYPILMIGADYNAKALEAARRTLETAGVPNITLFGDVTDPTLFAQALGERGFDSVDGLHIRAFIDHNRRYTEPPRDKANADKRLALSTGAYADETGKAIPNQLLEQNLVEHLRRWTPFIRKHGLIVIEAHNVYPPIAAEYNGNTHATAFDTYHGYSNQYPIDYEAFMSLAEEAGFRAVGHEQRVYPSRLPFVAISLNRFKTAGPIWIAAAPPLRDETSWRPSGSEDTLDGEALHRFLYHDGDLTRPRRWCATSTGMLVGRLLEDIERRLDRWLDRSSTSRQLTLADYGAGTGLATLELIKGLRETGLMQRMERNGIKFKLLLFDFPGGWFAKAYELLNAFTFIDFHSLTDPVTGKIRLISDILTPESVDIIYASMVLHLVPPKAMPPLIDSFAEVLQAHGSFYWNSPDTAPTSAYSEVIHAPNRALRRALLDLIDDEARVDQVLAKVPPDQRGAYADLPQRLVEIRRSLTPERRALAKARADKQILAIPTHVEYIEGLLNKYFDGEVATMVSVLSEDDALALALLPANQRYFNEIEDTELRRRLITLLLRYDVLPRFRAGTAGNASGINLHWTYGEYVKNG